jgi:hypothetical protein
MSLHEAQLCRLGTFVSMHNAYPVDFVSSLSRPYLFSFPIYSLYMHMPLSRYVARDEDKYDLVWILDQNQYC